MRDRYHMSRAARPAVRHTTLRMVGIVAFPVNRTHQRYTAQFSHKRTIGVRAKLVGMDQYANYLVSNYGRQSDIILEHLKKQDVSITDLELAKAELRDR